MEAIAMTDHGALYGAIDFYREATARGIKPIIGVEAYVAPGSRASPASAATTSRTTSLLAQNMTGYQNLITLVTKAHLEGYYYKPRIDRELMEQHSAGITVLSGCPSAEFHRRSRKAHRRGAEAIANWYREVFDGHYYLEVQDHDDEKFTRSTRPSPSYRQGAGHSASSPPTTATTPMPDEARQPTTCSSASARTRRSTGREALQDRSATATT